MSAPRRSRIVQGSCWPCRRRRVKCDLSKPACARCKSSDQECDYGSTPFKWVGGMALRGRHAPSPTSEALTPVPRLSTTPSMQLPDDDSLVLYFSNELLPKFQLSGDSIQVDHTAITQDQSLQQAVVALSGAHYSLVSKTRSSSDAVVRHGARYLAMSSLRQSLLLGEDSNKIAQNLFSANVLLCMLDGMIEPPKEQNASVCHLKGGFAMLKQWSNMTTSMMVKSGLQTHLLSIFATMDLVHALLSGEKPFFESIVWPMFADLQAWWGRLPGGDHFLTLLRAHSELAVLGNLVLSHLPAQSGVLLAEKCLPGVQSLLVAPSGEGNSAGTNKTPWEKNWTAFCSLYEICATVYSLRALRQRPVDDVEIQSTIRNGVAMLIDEVLPGMMAHCVILPILVIGAHCIHTQDRRAILEALSPSVAYLSFGNLPVMIDFLNETWDKGQMQATWWQMFASISDKIFLF